jgi:hypothetical protein
MKRILISTGILFLLSLGTYLILEPKQDIIVEINNDPIMSWGTYKPQLIHAVSNFSATPLTFSVMYFNPEKMEELRDLRYKVAKRPHDDIIFDY